MSEKIIVPTLGESVTEATVSKWLKSEGEKVDTMEEDLASLKNEISEIKSLLKELVNG